MVEPRHLDNRRPTAVIFDFDDTLATMAPFERDVAVPLISVFLESKGHPPAEVASWGRAYLRSGGGMLTSQPRMAAAFGACSDDELAIVRALLKLPSAAAALPGTQHVLSHLRRVGVPIAIASNKADQLLHRDLTKSGLGTLIGVVVSSSDVGGVPKPDPALVIRAMDELGIPAEQRDSVIYVGNRPHDVAAAIAAGVRPWLVGFGHPRNRIDPSLQGVLEQPGVEYFSTPQSLNRRLRTLTAPGLAALG